MAARKVLNFSSEDMLAILTIGRAIHALAPSLDETKYMEYSVGIFKASRKYRIDPTVMVAIAMQETGFREDLPEGKAGERGICQIRKMWLKNPKFIKEFRTQTIDDLDKPSKNFMFSAWILRDLKNSVSKGSLPFWSYYNSVRFENRFKYFLAVNRNIATLLRHEIAQNEIAVADAAAQEAARSRLSLMPPRNVAAPAQASIVPMLAPTPSRVINAQKPAVVAERPAPVKQAPAVVQKPRVEQVKRADFSGDVQDLVTEGGHWIPDAMQRLQKQKEEKKQNDKQASHQSFLRQIAANP